MKLYKIIREWDEDANQRPAGATEVDIVTFEADAIPEGPAGDDCYATLGQARRVLTIDLRRERDALNATIRRVEAINNKTVTVYEWEDLVQ